MTKVSPRSGRIGFFLSFFNFRVRAVESKSSRTIFVQPPIAQYRELARSRWGWLAAVRRRTLGGCGYAQIPLERGLEKSLCFSLSFFLGFLCSSLACGIFTSQFIFGCIFSCCIFSCTCVPRGFSSLATRDTTPEKKEEEALKKKKQKKDESSSEESSSSDSDSSSSS